MNKKIARTLAGAMSLLLLEQAAMFKDSSAENILSDMMVSATESVLSEDNYNQIHWAVTEDYTLLLSPKEGETTASIDDFYETYTNSDPLVQPHETEMPIDTPWHDYVSKITAVQVQDGITSIGDYAFYNLYALKDIYLADSVTRIGRYAFQGTVAETIRFSENLTSINTSAFSGCQFSSLTLPDSVTSIGVSAFQNCSSLIHMDFSRNLTKIGDSAFYGCTALEDISFPEGLVSIGQFAFRDCTSLQNLLLPDSLTALSKGSFYGCTSLTTVTFGTGLTEIPWQCFSDCSSLMQIVLDENIAAIGNTAFQDCTALSYVFLGASVESLGSNVFSHCDGLEFVAILNPSLTVPPSQDFGSSGKTDFTIYGVAGSTAQTYAEKYGIAFSVYGDISEHSYPFGEGLYWTLLDGILTISGEGVMPDYARNGTTGSTPPWFLYQEQIKTVVIEEGITHIGDRAFQQMKTVTEVSLPYTLQSIGAFSFYQTSIRELSIPDNVISLGEQAFRNCAALTTLVIPEEVTEIPDYLCANCTELIIVTLPSTLISIGSCAFENCPKLGNLAFPHALKTVGDFAFYKCTSMTATSFSDHLVSIGSGAFGQCSNLTEMRLGSNLESIGAEAFYESGLTGDVTIPPTVENLGHYSFVDCPGITSFTILNADLFLIAGKFGYVSGETEYVPIATTFYGISGSTTENYATTEDVFSFVSLDDVKYEKGDCNLDGTVSVADAVLLQHYLLGSKTIQQQQFAPCDVNDDGNVNGFDLAMLRGKLKP